MKVREVVILSEVAGDLNDGKVFYDHREPGVGGYFWDSLFADIESLIIYAGIHVRTHGLYRMLARRFPYAIYYEIAGEVAYVVAVLAHASQSCVDQEETGRQRLTLLRIGQPAQIVSCPRRVTWPVCPGDVGIAAFSA